MDVHREKDKMVETQHSPRSKFIRTGYGPNGFGAKTADSEVTKSVVIKDKSQMVTVADKIETVNLGSTQNRFESLDFVDQAKVVRIQLNKNRQNRFMAIFDQKKTRIHNKIKSMGCKAISKSVLGDQFHEQLQKNNLKSKEIDIER